MLSQGRRHEILFTAITYVLFKESCVNLSDKEVINSTVDYPTNLSMSSYMDIILINQLFLLIKHIYVDVQIFSNGCRCDLSIFVR